jgi:hypothetical protein
MYILPDVLNFGFIGIVLFVFILVALFVLIIWFARRLTRKYRTIPTYDQYIHANPDSKTKDGIICRKCHSSRIAAKRVGHTPGSALFSHICENCGTTLFRSKG